MKDPRVGVGVAVLVRNADGEFAMLRRSEDASHGQGQWSFPGGWIDWEEDPQRAAEREALEETTLVVKAAEPCAIVTNTYPDEDLHILCIMMYCTLVEGTLTLAEPDKATEVAWVAPAALPDMKTAGILFAPVADFVDSLLTELEGSE